MKRIAIAAVAILVLAPSLAAAQGGLERLYVLDCGINQSMQRLATVLAEQRAQLWINHDKPQSSQLRYAPAYYE